MRFSIVIPTYNEEADITDTLASLCNLDYADYEILVVDESSDRTPEIVKTYPDPRVRYARQTRSTGRSAARNQGILEASGEIVMILNADVHLPANLLDRLRLHYEAGADYVVIDSAVENYHELFPRYVDACHKYFYQPSRGVDMNWCEGFTCRREAAIDAGLFPEGDAFPIIAGEDGWFGERLRDAGYKKVHDRTIQVQHVAPTTIRAFLHQRAERGHGSSQVWTHNDGYTGWRLFLLILWHVSVGIAGMVLLVPTFINASKFADKSLYGWKRDILPFFGVRFLDSFGNIYGISRGYLQYLRGTLLT